MEKDAAANRNPPESILLKEKPCEDFKPVVPPEGFVKEKNPLERAIERYNTSRVKPYITFGDNNNRTARDLVECNPPRPTVEFGIKISF